MKKVPVRTCIGCRETKPKEQLVRIVRTRTGGIEIDPSGKVSGRGAYVCDKDCFEASVKKKKVSQALKTTVGPDEIEKVREFLSRTDLG